MSQSPVDQAARYGIVGLCVVAADFLFYLGVLALLPDAYLTANACGKAAGALLGFVLHKHVTFAWAQRDGTMRQLLSYAGLFLANLMLSSVLLGGLIGILHFNALLAKIVVDGIVIGVSFLASRNLIYRRA